MNLFFRPLCRAVVWLLTSKCLLAMRLTIILLTVSVLQVAAKGYSQVLTISLKDAPLEKVFVEIRKQTGYNFFYKVELLEKASPVSIRVTNLSLIKVLDLCFKNQPLTYVISGKSITIQAKEAA